MLNLNIIKWFKLLIKQLEFYVDTQSKSKKLEYSYKLKSISKALKVIMNLDYELDTSNVSNMLKIKGIGEGTIKRIKEILETGQLSEVNDSDISGAHLEYVSNLMKIFGIGRSKAYELYTVYNIKTIEELKEALKSNKIDLPHSIKVGLKYVDQINTQIPRAEIDEMYSLLILWSIELDPELDVRICGSYRRELDYSGDIDIIISHPSIKTKAISQKSDLLKRYIELLQKKSFIIDSLTGTDTPTKYMGLCKLHLNPIRRIDIRFIAQESYYTAILYFTGSANFNTQMRRVAQSLGYMLNEYFLKRGDEIIQINSEKDVFDVLKMEYVIPKERY